MVNKILSKKLNFMRQNIGFKFRNIRRYPVFPFIPPYFAQHFLQPFKKRSKLL